MTKRARLIDIVECCVVRFDRGDVATWKHSDFVDLNQEIHRDTNVNISPNTLKRIFGKISVDDYYSPQQATIEALIKYGRYFPPEINVQPETNLEADERVTEERAIYKNSGKVKPYKWIFISATIVVIAICGMLALKTLMPGSKLSGSIILTKTEGLLPATALFKLQLPDTQDSLFVNFGDKTTLAYINPEQNTIAHNYLFPGVFNVILQTRKNVIATRTVSIRSEKWIGLSFRIESELPEHYYEFPAHKTGDDSVFKISNSQLYSMGLDTNGLFYTRLCNFTPIKYAPEDFIFEATFKNSVHEKGVYCKGTQFQVSGINGFIRFKLASPGCSYRVINVLSEQTFRGSRDDLSKFVLDLEKWNNVKLINRNKQVSFYVNNKLLFNGTYEISLGSIQGLFLEFEGNGFVKNCDLKSLDGEILYRF